MSQMSWGPTCESFGQRIASPSRILGQVGCIKTDIQLHLNRTNIFLHSLQTALPLEKNYSRDTECGCLRQKNQKVAATGAYSYPILGTILASAVRKSGGGGKRRWEFKWEE